MTLVKQIRKTVTDTTPVYAAVGVTDLAVERLCEARARAAAVRPDLSVSAMQDRAGKGIEKVTEQALHMPAQVRAQTVEAADKAQHTYTELAVRGEKLVKRLRSQKATQDLLAQADNTVSLGKGVVTTVRKAAVDTRRAAKASADHQSQGGRGRSRSRCLFGQGRGRDHHRGCARGRQGHSHLGQAHRHDRQEEHRCRGARGRSHGRQCRQDRGCGC